MQENLKAGLLRMGLLWTQVLCLRWSEKEKQGNKHYFQPSLKCVIVEFRIGLRDLAPFIQFKDLIEASVKTNKKPFSLNMH